MPIPMSPRERFLTAFALKEPDRVPITDEIFNADIYQAVLGYRPGYFTSEDSFKCSRELGLDAAFVLYEGYQAIEPVGNVGGGWVSEWGVTYQTHEGAWGVGMPIAYQVRNRQEWEHFIPPNPNKPGRMDSIKRTVDLRTKGPDLALIGAVRGPFANTAYHFVGMVDTMMAIYDDPGFLSLAFQMTVDFDIEVCRQMVESGVDVLWITEDIAGSSGPLIKPGHYHELALPHLRRLLSAIRDMGKPIVFHSDGNVLPFLEDLIDAGITGLNPIERTSGMDLGEMKARFGDRICLLGNVDNKTILTDGSPQQVEEDVKSRIRLAGKGGGYILISDNSWHSGVGIENARSMVRAGKKWGTYPLDWIESNL
jgi:uroporphyrinogen decarboxylase